MLMEALSTARDLGRLHEIAGALIRHGLGEVVRRLHVAPVLERTGRVLHWKRTQGLSSRTTPERVRLLLEELGPAFVKLGQVLAGRTDLLPPDWTDELSQLQESSGPAATEYVLAQLEEDLGASAQKTFADFDPAPLAAGSIAQVHAARLEDGTRVVLKVRRPGIVETVEADLRLLARLARVVEEEMPELRRFRPRSLVRQLSRSLRDEMDLRHEARNARRLAGNLGGDSALVVPRIHERFTRERLCVMDRLEGASLGAWIRDGKPGGHDPRRIARTGADAVLEMVLVHGFFHADPHPGNVFLLEGGRIGLCDFGMVGRLSQSRRIEFLKLLAAVVDRREGEVVDVLLAWSQGNGTDLDLLTQDCGAFVDRYHGISLRELDVGRLLGDVTSLLRDNDLFLPADVALLIKVFVTLEALGRSLDPDFVMSERIEPFAREALRAHASPGAVIGRGAREAGRLLIDAPRELRKLVGELSRGHMRMEVGVRDFERFAGRIDKSASRITMGLVTSALIVGTAIAMTVTGGPTLFGLPFFGLLGFSSSLVAGVWLLVSIARSK